MAETPITPQILLERTGRENGPDFMLKVEVPEFTAGSVINSNSNITEVLNVIAYLCNKTNRTDATAIEPDHTIDTATNGLHLPNGQYSANNGSGASADSLWLDGAEPPAPTTQMIDLDTLLTPAGPYTANNIPVGLLARTPVAGGLGTTYGTPDNLAIAAYAGPDAGAIPEDTRKHFSNAIKQMIHILENTRKIFGPKGWTALFNTVKGGASSSAAKRTNRHRRK